MVDLERMRKLIRIIREMEERATAARERTERVTSQITGMPRGGNVTLQDNIAHMIDVQSSIDRMKDEYGQLLKDALPIINELEEPRRTAMLLRYGKRMSTTQTANEMGYTWRHVMKLLRGGDEEVAAASINQKT